MEFFQILYNLIKKTMKKVAIVALLIISMTSWDLVVEETFVNERFVQF